MITADRTVPTTCPYCGVGCSLELHIKDDYIYKVTSPFDSVVNHGNLCIKGRYGYEFIHSADRIKTPLIRRGDTFYEATWDEAIDLIADKFTGLIKKYGNKSVGAFSSSRCTNEENFLIAKFARTVFRNNNVDNCARV